ncbi:MAG: ribonuclease III domain-containing protein [Benniella sp.]|nr:MAG: ribonuclease III domain-containing protein [Benniella sp.]
MLRDAYQDSKADQNINLPHNEAELFPVEEAIGYHFKNKKLLELALTAPVKGDPGPDYDRLEFLGDAVLEVMAVIAWINEGSVARSGPKTENTVCNRTLQAVCIDTGLEDHIRRCDEDTEAKIGVLKASYPVLKLQSQNKPYWNQGPLAKTLGDVIESVYGAVFLDSGLRLSAVEGVFNRIHWPIVERRLA